MRPDKGRLVERLKARQVATLGEGKYGDGGGLYLRVVGRHRGWVFRYKAAGKAHECGLGPLHTLTLAEARAEARRCRQMRLKGIDPIAAGRAARAAVALEAANAKTFAECATTFHAAHCAAWKNKKHAREWLASLTAHVFPQLGALAVADIDTGHMLRALEPIWTTIPETAGRIRGRIEAVLDWAKTRGYRNGENPARWKGHLDHLLPDRRQLAPVEHFAALPYRDIPAFAAELRAEDSADARALAFQLLTVVRPGEATGTTWDEIDLAAKLWTIPAARMKKRREHRVPLAPAAIAILERTPQEHRHGPVFPGAKPGKPVSVISLWRRANAVAAVAVPGAPVTAHGLRSSFRDWAAERTSFPDEVAEQALAHSVGSKVRRSYQRGDLLAKRRQLMEAWARYCASAPSAAASADVVPLRGPRRG